MKLRTLPGLMAVVLGSVAVFATTGCSSRGAAAAQPEKRTSTPAATDLPAVLARIGDDSITIEDIRAEVGGELDQMEVKFLRARHKLVDATLQEILRNRVLLAEATKQNKTVDELLAAEVGGSLEPSEVDISTWYSENKDRTGGRSLEQLKTQIADYLRKQRRDDAAEKLDIRLAKERKVSVNLEPFRVPLNNTGAPALGPESAPVTLVEFSDFQCPFCARFYPTLKQLEQNFGDKLRIVYRQYPITNIHPNAFKASEASLCASDQGKFWQLHDLMFQQQNRLSVKDLKAAAGQLGLNQKAFDTCLDSGRYAAQVQEDLQEGARVGVNGTPALFVNGVPIDGGAVPYETVVEAIQKELRRLER